MSDYDSENISIGEMNRIMNNLPEIKNDAIGEYVQQTRRDFADHIINEASSTLHREELGEREFVEILNEIDSRGFDVYGDRDTDDALVQVFAHPDVFHGMMYEYRVEWYTQDETGANHIRGVSIYPSPELPEGHAVFIHDRAVAPNPIGEVERPWLVKHPKGVVPVQVGYAEEGE